MDLRRLFGDAPPRIWGGALVATLATALVAWRMKARCLTANWGSPEPFTARCYTDVQALYSHREYATQWPYRDVLNEYPPLSALWQTLTARATDSVEGYLHLNAFLFGLLAVATTVILLRAGARHRVFLWALAPALATYMVYNWDLLAVLPTVAALWAWRSDRPGLAGALLAVATLAKWWPAVLLPILGVALLRRERGLGRQGLRFGAWAIGILVVVNGAVWLWAGQGYLDTYRFHAGRGSTLESHWFTLKAYLDRWDLVAGPTLEAAESWGPRLYALLLGTIAVLVWRGHLAVLPASLAAVAGWQVLMPVLSMQYALWVVPLAILARAPWRLVMAHLAADLLVFLSVMRFHASDGEDFWRALEPQAVASIARLLALAALVAWALWTGRKSTSQDEVEATDPVDAGASAPISALRRRDA